MRKRLQSPKGRRPPKWVTIPLGHGLDSGTSVTESGLGRNPSQDGEWVPGMMTTDSTEININGNPGIPRVVQYTAMVQEGESQTARTDNIRSATCSYCNRTFKNYPGRRQHERRAHAQEYHEEGIRALDAQTRRRWTAEEQFLMAKREASLIFDNLKPDAIVATLSKEFDRTLESLKKRGLRPKYNEQVEEELTKLRKSKPARSLEASALVVPPVQEVTVTEVIAPSRKRRITRNTVTQENTQQDSPVQELDVIEVIAPRSKRPITRNPITQENSQQDEGLIDIRAQIRARRIKQRNATLITDTRIPVIEERNEYAASSDDTEAETRRLETFKHIFSMAGQEILRNLWKPENRMGIDETHVAIEMYTNEFLTSEGLVKPVKIKSVKRPTTKPPKGGRQVRRAWLMQLTQSRFDKDPAGCIRCILNDTLVPTQPVNEEELRNYWRTVFEKIPNCEPFDCHKYPVIYGLSSPITRNEVKLGISKLKRNSSPGVDGITSDDVKKVELQKLTILFNIFQAASFTPGELRLGAVTMVPKIPEPTLPQHYRPITVVSSLLRLYHGILGRRFDLLPISPRQKAYKTLDGIAENIWIVSELIDHAKRSKKDFNLCFLDVAKAFDSVGHAIIQQATERLGIPVDIRKYLDLLYSTSEMVFRGSVTRFKQRGGVRQGCQLSGPIFNGVADMGNENLDSDVEYKIDNEVGIMAGLFADDEFNVAETKRGLQHQVDLILPQYSKCGLQMNTGKCKTLSLRYDGKRKKMLVDDKPFLKINGELVPTIGPEETYKYLGVQLGAGEPTYAHLKQMLEKKLIRVDKSCLRPQQKLLAVRQHILPGLYHVLVFSKCGKGNLLTLDRNIRWYVRKWCHLPKDTAKAFFHAALKDGGLGIPSLELRIPRLRRDRNVKLSASEDPVVQALLKTKSGIDKIRNIHKPVTKYHINVVNTESENEVWSTELYSRVDGRGLLQHSRNTDVNDWISNCKLRIGAGDFIRAIHVRANTLKTPSRAARGRTAGGDNLCKLDRQVANSNHIFQTCHLTHGLRVNRHDELVKMLRTSLAKNGYKTLMEPKIKYGNTYRKPDLLIYKDKEAFILDPIICNDRVDLSIRKAEKEILYGSDEILLGAQELIKTCDPMSKVERISAHGIPMSYRGSIDNLTVRFLKRLGVPRKFINLMILRVLGNTWKMWRAYNNCALT